MKFGWKGALGWDCPHRTGRRWKRRHRSTAESAPLATEPLERGVRAPGADSGYQRPLSCLRSDELQASSFAGASEDAISSS